MRGSTSPSWATSHGGYHLDCNPPATMTPTGAWLGDGGDVVEGQRDGYYPIAG